MTPRVRRFALTAHVTASVGWLGAVAVFVALALVAMTSQDARTARGAYLVMAPAAWYILVPLSVASLLTGIIQSLGTTWGLVRHYWVLFKLLINVFATVILLLYMQTLGYLADVAAVSELSGDELRALAVSPLLHSVVGLAALLVATVLSVYKPKGMTPYGQRKQRRQRAGQVGQPALSQPQPQRSAR